MKLICALAVTAALTACGSTPASQTTTTSNTRSEDSSGNTAETQFDETRTQEHDGSETVQRTVTTDTSIVAD